MQDVGVQDAVLARAAGDDLSCCTAPSKNAATRTPRHKEIRACFFFSELVTRHECCGSGLTLLKADVSVFVEKAKHLSGCGGPCSTAGWCFLQLY